MVLHCIARVNQSRVAGVCPQIVTHSRKTNHLEPERAIHYLEASAPKEKKVPHWNHSE